ncbi:MAG: hypothetical protein L0219_09125 [Phycisphaerales bacterium]|nr:hypothetical protein [Phycisphaerales bacterium]
MGKKTAKPPDYRAAAEEQGQSSREAINMQTYANRANQYTPFGSLTYAAKPFVDPATGQKVTTWEQYTKLSPELQRALSAQTGLQIGRSELAGDMFGRIQDEMTAAPDYSTLHRKGMDIGGATQYTGQAGDALWNAFQARMQPQFQRALEQQDAMLRARGLKPGDAAYDDALAQLRQSQADQSNQAMYQAQQMNAAEAQRLQGMDTAASSYANTQRQGDMAEMLMQRGFSLNEANALLTGQQVGMPQMPSYNTAGAAQPVNYLGAAQSQFAADQANANVMNAAVGNIVGAATKPFSFGLGG